MITANVHNHGANHHSNRHPKHRVNRHPKRLKRQVDYCYLQTPSITKQIVLPIVIKHRVNVHNHEASRYPDRPKHRVNRYQTPSRLLLSSNKRPNRHHDRANRSKHRVNRYQTPSRLLLSSNKRPNRHHDRANIEQIVANIHNHETNASIVILIASIVILIASIVILIASIVLIVE
jgi:hypothetical protein